MRIRCEIADIGELKYDEIVNFGEAEHNKITNTEYRNTSDQATIRLQNIYA